MILWRVGVAISLTAAAVRAGGLGFLLPGIVWYGLQFGPLLVLGVMEGIGWFRARDQGLQPRARWVIGFAAGMAVLAAASSLWATDPPRTISQAGLLAVTFLFLTTAYAQRWTDSETLLGDLQTVLWTGIALEAIGVMGYFTGQAWAIGDFDRLVGVTPNANYVGIASAVLVALSFTFSGAWVRIAALIPLVALVLSDSRGAMIGLIVGLVAILISVPTIRRNLADRSWLIATILGVPLLFFLRTTNLFSGLRARTSYPGGGGTATSGPGSVPETDVTSGRIDIYREYLEIWLRQPWIGTGYRSPQVEVRGHTFEAHNVYLSVLVELGVLGAIALLGLFVSMLLSASRHTPLVGAAATALAVEVTESSLFGLGGPAATMSWLVVFGWAATGLAPPHSSLASTMPASPPT